MYDNGQELAEQPTPREIDGAEIKPSTMTKQDYLRNYEIKIKFLHYGCIIQVGCKEIAFSDITIAMKELNYYVNHPDEAQEQWFKIFAS